MDPDLNPCNDPGYIKDENQDPIPPYCRDREFDEFGQPIKQGENDPFGRAISWLEEATLQKEGDGASALCDPMQTGHITNEQALHKPNFGTLYRYSKSLRGTDEAMMDVFRDLVVLDDEGKAHPVPIIWATQERAVAAILQENVRNDDSLVVDRVRLPMLAIHASGYNYNQNRYVYHKALDYLRVMSDGWRPGFHMRERYERDTVFGVAKGIPVDITYTLYAWTLYEEDMNQILTQIITKFSPMAYIRVRDISWEIGVKLDSISNNIDIEPGDRAKRVVKYQFDFTAESFVAQPLTRRKAVLKTKVELTDALDDDRITEVITRLEQAVKELEE